MPPRGGPGFPTAPRLASRSHEEPALCGAFARCFAGADGLAVLEHLRRTVLERRLAPNASDAELRHLEGQRYAVAHIVAMVERGCA
jgi:hypothetical protein